MKKVEKSMEIFSSRRLDMRKSVEVQVNSDFSLLLPSGIYEIKKMEPRRRLRSYVVLICLFLAIAGIIGFGYFCPDQVYRLFRVHDFVDLMQLCSLFCFMF